MWTFPALVVLANIAAVQTGDVSRQLNGAYGAIMSAQYAARAEPVAQGPEEARRIYDAYLNSIGQKVRSESDNSSGNTGDQSR